MDELTETTQRPGQIRSDLKLLLVLLLVTSVVRGWLVARTTVAARDSVGYIRYALMLETQPWSKAVQNDQQHPGYPMALMLVSQPVRKLLGHTDSITMQLSAQLTSALAAVLLVVPMFLLGQQLFDSRISFWAVLLFQTIPTSSRVLSDALSESVYILFACLALLTGVLALRRQAAGWFVVCGVCCGLAYLTRFEGLVLVVAVLALLGGRQLIPVWRRPWRLTLVAASCLLCSSAVVISPYVWALGALTNKQAPLHVIGAPAPEVGAEVIPVVPNQSPLCAAPRSGPLWALWSPNYTGDGRKRDLWWGLYAVGYEIVRAFYYWLWLPTLCGIVWFRGRLWSEPARALPLAVSALQLVALWRLASIMGYISERHLMSLLLCCSFWMCAALLAFIDRLQLGRSTATVSVLVLSVIAIGGVVEASRSLLHGNRTGFRAAGLWLADNARPEDDILDPFCWSHYYSGRAIAEVLQPPQSHATEVRQFVVLDHGISHHSHLPALHAAQELAKGQPVVYHWPERVPEEQAQIKVYLVQHQTNSSSVLSGQ